MVEAGNEAERYLVAGAKPWHRRIYQEELAPLPGQWEYIGSPEELTLERVRRIDPAFIFFLHWSWKVPTEIVEAYECVCFHMTDVPYGRGGSPLQNLIVRGHRDTVLTALRMVEDFDAGPVYLKEELSLAGSAEEIYIRATELSAEMIRRILRERPDPRPQIGDATVFRRRRPDESRIPPMDSLSDLYDFVRMLDADGYPSAFIEQDGFRYEFTRAALYDGRIVADVRITQTEEDVE